VPVDGPATDRYSGERNSPNEMLSTPLRVGGTIEWTN